MGFGNVSERRSAPPQIGVSVVILALGPRSHDVHDTSASHCQLWLPLVRRVRQPFLGCWALPGGDLRADRSLEQSAYMALESTTSLHPRYLEQLYTFGDPARSHGGLPMVSIVYWALVEQREAVDAEDDDNVRWFPEDDLPPLAFDHRDIIDYALARLRSKIEYSDVATRLLGPTFTLRQLHGVYEAIAGQSLDLANFRRKMLASGDLEDTGRKVREGRQRPAAVYRYVPSDTPGIASPWTGNASTYSRQDVIESADSQIDHEAEHAMTHADDALSPLIPAAHG
ncbi:NrtR DNA-binding winged helix domain-containing protein [Bifidobacterium scaligerum]|uniref:NrtR DNA-binding winged helix domain-containing protein n=1 Tax=Bifidobacterium scaligerum TaxID=2052656 RepID=UPI000E3CE569